MLILAALLPVSARAQDISEPSDPRRTAETELWIASKENISRIALAMHTYHDKHRQFPPAVPLGPDGKTPHSWRVELLPFLGASDIYERYRMDEPWDSAHNKKLLERMPSVFRHPKASRDSTNAAYFVFAGRKSIADDNAELRSLPATADTGFSDNPLFSSVPRRDGPRIFEATDRPSLTILLVEAERDIPWTKPEDLAFEHDKELPKVGNYWDDGFWIAFADGASMFIAREIDGDLLKLLITPADGQHVGEIPRARYELQRRLRNR